MKNGNERLTDSQLQGKKFVCTAGIVVSTAVGLRAIHDAITTNSHVGNIATAVVSTNFSKKLLVKREHAKAELARRQNRQQEQQR